MAQTGQGVGVAEGSTGTARIVVQYTAPFLSGSEGHLIQGNSAEAQFLEPRAVSYFPLETIAVKAEAVGFALSHTPPAGSPQLNRLWLVMQSASLLHLEAWCVGRQDQERLGCSVSFFVSTYKEMWDCLRRTVRLTTCGGRGKGDGGAWGVRGGGHPTVSSHSFTLGDMGVFKQVAAAQQQQQ